jgi:hypothetical protein
MPMKHTVCVCAALLSLLSAAAQHQQDELDLSQLEIPQAPEETSIPYFGIGGGFAGIFLFPTLDELNQKTQSWELGGFSAPLFLGGAEGFTAIGIVPNVRVGIFGVGGSKQLQRSFTLGSTEVTRTAELSVSMTGLSLGYAIVPFRSFTVLPVLSAGWGMLTLELAQAPATTRWEEIRARATADSLTFLHRLAASALFVHPQLYVEYAPLPFLALRLGGGYVLSSMGEWKQNRIARLEGVPSKVNFSGASAQFAIFLGLFN